MFKLSESFKVQYDVAICSYLFCYFDEEEKSEALVQILAATKVGGEIRIHTGVSGIMYSSRLMGEAVIEKANKIGKEKYKKWLQQTPTKSENLYCFVVKSSGWLF